jgi:hypothetical protein
MSPTYWLIFTTSALFAGMVGLYYTGHRQALKREAKGLRRETDALTGAALFGLFGLLIAFSFSGSIGRFEARRQLILQEVNAIGTAYLRVDLLPTESQEALRADFRAYCEVRRDNFEDLINEEARTLNAARTAELQLRIWQGSIAATSGEQFLPARVLVVPALNQMIDITTSRWIAARTHVPLMVFVTIFAVALYCAWLAGVSIREAKDLGWSNVIGLAGVTALLLHVMLDIEFPRIGFVNLDDYNRLFDDLALTMLKG